MSPTTMNNGMYYLELDGYIHTTNGILKYLLHGYRSSTTVINTLSKVSLGNFTLSNVYLGLKDSKFCVVLGTKDTTWAWAHIAITKAMIGHTYITDAYCSGWTTTMITTQAELDTYTLFPL